MAAIFMLHNTPSEGIGNGKKNPQPLIFVITEGKRLLGLDFRPLSKNVLPCVRLILNQITVPENGYQLQILFQYVLIEA
jgi:hypothetical protein